MATAPIKPSRKVGLHHFAFFRGHLEGMDIVELGDLYLETGDDRVRAKATLRWMRDELIAAARRQAQPAIARLLKIPLEKLVLPATTELTGPPMTLEDFQAERDPDGFYTEAELIKLFEEEVGTGSAADNRKAARNDRLRRRLREASIWLENFVSETPRPDDPLEAWLDETLAHRLRDAGLGCIDDLQLLMRKRGKHWYRKVPKLGPVGAARLHKWMVAQHFLPDTALVVPYGKTNIIALVTALAPLERFRAPVELSGAVGTNRRHGSTLGATDDWEAINAWLSAFGSRSHTVRSYRKEAERFLLWMIFEREKALSSATTEDCASYRDFLEALDENTKLDWIWTRPRSYWVGKGSRPRQSDDWKPFAGALSPASQKLAIGVLTGMCEWLVEKRYLEGNPWKGIKPTYDPKPTIRVDHSLSIEQWSAILDACYELPDNEAKSRLTFILLMAFSMGLRQDEMINAIVAKREPKAGDINPGLKSTPDKDWSLDVIGKGRKLRSVPMPADTLDALKDYMEDRGLGRDPIAWPEGTPLIVTLPEGLQYVIKGDQQALSHSQLYRLLQNHFKRTADGLEDMLDASHLRRASTHWLRHTFVSLSLEAGVEMEAVQELAGHASVATTGIYSHTSRRRKKTAVETLMAFSGKHRTTKQ